MQNGIDLVKRKEVIRRGQAKIERERAQILLETAKIDSEAHRVAADAETFAKQQILETDDALAQKLGAEIRIQELWAAAYAQRRVPQHVFGVSGGVGGSPTGGGQSTAGPVDAAAMLRLDTITNYQPERFAALPMVSVFAKRGL